MNEKQKIFDEISRVLADFEHNFATKDDLYKILVKVQINWESIITADMD